MLLFGAMLWEVALFVSTADKLGRTADNQAVLIELDKWRNNYIRGEVEFYWFCIFMFCLSLIKQWVNDHFKEIL